MKSMSFRFSSFFFFFSIVFFVAAIAEEEYSNALGAGACVYSITMKTGDVKNAGTDSRISIRLYDAGGSSIYIPSIARWGAMRPGHDFFERGNIDFFVVNEACTPSKVCRITVASDNLGNKPGWFLDYVDVTTTAPNRPASRTLFQFYQWFSIGDPPYQLSQSKNWCGGVQGGDHQAGLAASLILSDNE